jgi:signal transduction histidine kinase
MFGLAALGIASASGRPLRASELAPLAAAAVAASLVYYLHTFLIAFAVALDIGSAVRLVWVRNFRWLFPHYLILGLMGLGLAVASVELGPLGTALFLAPPLMMRFVLKQYTDRTIGAVRRLEATNAELRSASSLLQQRGEALALLSDVGQLAAVQLHPDRLPALIAERCVPTLGDVCGLVWARAALGRAAHAAPGAEHVAMALAAQPADVVQRWAESLATHPNDQMHGSGWAADLDGYWTAAPLPGRDGPLGWLLSWRAPAPASDDADGDGTRNIELMHEVARRLALLLERETLLQEAAALDALRAVDRAKSDFIATTAHELRTPLTSLQGYAELLRRDEIEPSRRDRWLHILEVEAAQIGLVLDQFLDVSRLEAGWFKAARRSVDLAAVIDRVVDAFTAQAALSGHSFEAYVPAALPRVYADSTQLERVLRNLVSNALKYAPKGGPVRIRAMHAGKGEIEVCVEDRGLGIPPEWLGRLFERFERVNTPERASIRGTGLGLYIARQMVELNGGRIWATSAGGGQGATFHFTLSVAPRRARSSQPLDRA